MKINKKILEKLIKEEISALVEEESFEEYPATPERMTGEDAVSMGFRPKEATWNEKALYKRAALAHKHAVQMANELDQRITKIENSISMDKKQPGAVPDNIVNQTSQPDSMQEKLIRIVKEEINNIIKEFTNEPDPGQRDDDQGSPRSAYLSGSKYAGAGKYMGKGGNLAFRKKKCQGHLKKWGNFQLMPDCEEIMNTPDEHDVATSDDAALSLSQIDDRLADIEQRLNKAGIQ